MAMAGGRGRGIPFPVTWRIVGELAALLVIVRVAFEEIVPRGAKITSNERVPDGAKSNGKGGRVPGVKNEPVSAMELIVTELCPVLVMMTVFFDDVVIGTSPKATGFGATEMSNCN